MTVTEINILHEKAKTRKDGIYKYQNYYWAVKNGKFIAYVDYFGLVKQRMGFFDVEIGQVNHLYRKEKLAEWLKKQ